MAAERLREPEERTREAVACERSQISRHWGWGGMGGWLFRKEQAATQTSPGGKDGKEGAREGLKTKLRGWAEKLEERRQTPLGRRPWTSLRLGQRLSVLSNFKNKQRNSISWEREDLC